MAPIRIQVLHGPNLNLLGTREPDVYGNTTLDQINNELLARAESQGVSLSCYQSNIEGELVDRIQACFADNTDFLIMNAGAYTHTSVAIRDAIQAVNIPLIEVHLSNVFARDEFRHHSYLSDIAQGVICGFGANSYMLALDAAIQTLRS